MSAESHQKRALSTTSDAVRLVPNIVPPQAVSDRSIIDSVAGFINDVALTNAPQSDPKDHILWAKFENLADISDFSLGEDWDVEGNLPPPLLLCIGYGSGVQVWAVPANGEAIEVMSWKHGAVKVLRILPTPFLSSNSELASDLLDQFIHKRPLMALCGDYPNSSQPPSQNQQNQQFHAVNFVSLKDGDVVKSIRFKSPIVDIIANRTSIAITFPERIAVFDARTLEDRLTVTTCYPCPGGLCPIALGDRWLAYAEKKMIPSKASAGGCFFDGVSSYTATVLNAAKSLSKGLRELGEHVAAGLTGSSGNMMHQAGVGASSNVNADGSQPGIVTILDIKHQIKDISPTSGTPVAVNGNDPIVAHFLAHTEAVTSMAFDPSGMLLLTADRRGHDFNVFRIQPHPSGSVLAAVHHLYVLHRGDTSAKVQDITFSFDSRWVAVSSLRGTTHVFPITPYGGQPGFRTHSALHVVNRLSRFHRSAGLTVDGRSSSPILMAEHAAQSTAYANPRLPPFPHPTVVLPLAQLRQPTSLNSASSLTSLASPPNMQQGSKGHMNERQRLHSNEESQSKPLRVAAVFAKARSWLLDPPGLAHETPTRLNRRPVDSLFVIAGHGALIQYDLEPRQAANIPKDKICDESPIELEVEAKAQWILGSRSSTSADLSPPLPSDNWLIKDRVIDSNLNLDASQLEYLRTDERDDRWLSQVEIVTHAGPHRRLWMGPQFIFKTYNTPSGNSLAHIDVESVEIGASRSARTTPMNMPLQPNTSARPMVPVLIESGSCSKSDNELQRQNRESSCFLGSHEQSPRLLDSFHYESANSEIIIGPDSQLREDLADAMKDCAGAPIDIESANNDVLKTISFHSSSSNGTSLPNNINSQTVVVSIVNPQGTVTTVTNNSLQLDESFSTEYFIHENCDETMFRPVVAVINDGKVQGNHNESINNDNASQPVEMQTQLIVPVIDEKLLEKKKKEKELEKLENSRQKQKIEEARQEKIAEKAQIEMNEVIDKKKEDEKLEEVPISFQKKGKKGQKLNKKTSELEKKLVEVKVKERSTLKSITVESLQEPLEVIQVLADEKKEIVEAKYSIVEQPQDEPPVFIDHPDVLEKIALDKPELDEKPLKVEDVEVKSFKKPLLQSEIASEKFVATKVEPATRKAKKGKKYPSGFKSKEPEKVQLVEERLSPLGSPPPLDPPPIDDYRTADSEAIMKISKHESIGDDEIEIFPLKDSFTIQDSPDKSDFDVEMKEEHFNEPENLDENLSLNLKFNEGFYDMDDDLPPLEPLEAFDVNFEPISFVEEDEAEEPAKKEASPEADDQKMRMKQKLSELLKDTNMIFAMCSSLKEETKDEDDTKSMNSSQIQRSTSSSQTTNTTTATFASATSNQTGEGQDSDYKSLELDIEDEAAPAETEVEIEFKMPLDVKQLEDAEDISSFEATSSETDDSSKKSSSTASKFKREDDEELRPLLQTSISSLPSPISSSTTTTTSTTEANDASTLPETNQKLSSTQATSNNGNGNKRKNKKKRR